MKDQHNKIIAKIATEMFKPYGIKRKGQSRTFIDDHGWFIIIIEFQPSNWDKGTYLNIGINFNWYLHDYFSFDIGYREKDFIKFTDEKQFSEDIHKLCIKSIKRVTELRNEMNDIKTAMNKIIRNTYTSDDLWGNYHRGIISGIVGNLNNLNKYFDKLLKENDDTQWIIELKQTTKELKETANIDINKFKKKIMNIIKETRAIKKLNEMEIIIK